MEKPRVFVSPINKKINNSQELYYGSNNEERKEDKKDIIKKINEIFSSINHVYKSKVLVTTIKDSFICDVVGKTSSSLLTLNGDVIPIKDILDIKKYKI
jgi:hypothetical protein